MNWIDTMSPSGTTTRFSSATQSILSHSPLRLIGMTVRWLIKLQDDRMARIELRSMDEHMLKDIGMTRGQVEEHLQRNHALRQS